MAMILCGTKSNILEIFLKKEMQERSWRVTFYNFHSTNIFFVNELRSSDQTQHFVSHLINWLINIILVWQFHCLNQVIALNIYLTLRRSVSNNHTCIYQTKTKILQRLHQNNFVCMPNKVFLAWIKFYAPNKTIWNYHILQKLF